MPEIDGDSERRLAVENATASAFASIDNDFISWHNLKNLMTTVFPDQSHLRVWLSHFKIWKNVRGNESRLPMEYPKFEDIRDELRMALNDRINKSDDLTRISAMNYANRLWHQFDDFNPKIFIKPMAQQNGIMYHIWGVPGSGKTAFGFTIIDIALKENYYVICNMFSLQATLIRFGEEIKTDRKRIIPNFFRTVRMSDLIYKCILIIESGNRNIVVGWDEVSTFMHRQDAPTKSNIDISRFLRLIRKFNINIIFLEQIDEGLAATANEMLGAKIHKISRKKIHYMTRFLERNYNEFLESVPDSPISFKTGDFAGFINDVDFKDMFEKIAIEDEGDKLQEIKKYIVNIINKNKEVPPKIIKQPKQVVQAKKLIEGGCTITEAAKKVGWSREHLSRKLKEYDFA
jgi:DNA-binding phage protein